ncbi:hypothetical protein MYXA107069_36790 [Myxococcus xanthus]|nr:hypothetical protein [Myxococcus xanthus]QZZ51297.1 hypothetical protein MyxoNM_19030 [Myxococcus xanthus]SDY31671.1 hypothetical protein SAMN05444383_1383 [Myxococcus xanthus]
MRIISANGGLTAWAKQAVIMPVRKGDYDVCDVPFQYIMQARGGLWGKCAIIDIRAWNDVL